MILKGPWFFYRFYYISEDTYSSKFRFLFISKRNPTLLLSQIMFLQFNPKSFYVYIYRSSRSEMFYKIDVLKNFAKFTRRLICRSLFFNKVTGWHFLTFPWFKADISLFKVSHENTRTMCEICSKLSINQS